MEEGYEEYKNTKIQTANNLQLVVMLYEGAIKFLKQAKLNLDQKELYLVNTNISKTQNIIGELLVTLNKKDGGEIAVQLQSLYMYINRRLLEANLKKTDKEQFTKIIDEVITLLLQLKNAWEVLLKSKQANKIQHNHKNLDISS